MISKQPIYFLICGSCYVVIVVVVWRMATDFGLYLLLYLAIALLSMISPTGVEVA